MNIEALDTIELLTNQEVEPVICTERMLNQLFGSIYGVQSSLGGVVEDIEQMQHAEEPTMVAETTADDLQVGSLEDMAAQAPVIRLVNSILSQAVRDGTSDIHISPEQARVSVRFRIDGKLHEVPAPPKSMLLPIISRFKILVGYGYCGHKGAPGRALYGSPGKQGNQCQSFGFTNNPWRKPGLASARYGSRSLLPRPPRHVRYG